MIKYNGFIFLEDAKTIVEKLSQHPFAVEKGYLKKIRNSKNGVQTCCPFHNEKNPSMGVRNDGVFHCFACKKKGFITELIEFTTQENAFDWLIKNVKHEKDKINLQYRKYSDKNIKTHETIQIQQNDIVYYHPRAYQYLNWRGIPNQTIDMFEIGYNPKRDSIIFPIKNYNGITVGWQERSINNKSFYNNFKKNSLFAVDKVYEYLKKISYITIVESIIDCMILWAYGIPAVATLGANVTNEQIEILKNIPIYTFILAFDNDDAGEKATKTVGKKIRRFKILYQFQFPKGFKDFGDCVQRQPYVNGTPMVIQNFNNNIIPFTLRG